MGTASGLVNNLVSVRASAGRTDLREERRMLAELRKSLYEVPLIQTLGVVPVVMAPGEVSLELPHRPSLLDHAGALHTAALFGVAELAAGVVLATHPALEHVRVRRTSSAIDYLTPCYGDVVARATVEESLLATIRAGADRATEVTIPVRVHDAVDNDIAVVRCQFVVSPPPDR
ncbi:MAG: DUF4442 domain-containing protein, partial [Myxococcota bacterium]